MLDLVVVGCGPVGAVAGNLAGRAGLTTLVLDRSPEVYSLPRAIHFDAHIMRILQQAGLADEVLPNVREWRSSTFYGADSKPIRVHEWPKTDLFGWKAHYLFYQPTLERILRGGLSRLDNVDVALSTELVGLSQHQDHVSVTVRDIGTSDTQQVEARFVVGADGASSSVRRNAGIELIDGAFDEPWLVVDVICEQQIGRPNESEMFCDPRRPSTRVPGPGNHHRWEFMLLPGETAEQIQRPESIEELLAPWVSMDEVTVLRASVYRFHSLVAASWRDRRVFLAGDAAHQTPPFLGQGMCHGIRDVQNVVEKVLAVFSGGPPDELLNSYETERRPHVEQIIHMAVTSGREICLLDPVAAVDRDRRMRRAAARGKLPSTTFQGMPPLRGGLFSDTPGAGELFQQPIVNQRGRRGSLFDDAFEHQVVVAAHHSIVPDIKAFAAKLGVPVVGVLDPTGSDVEMPSFDAVIRDPQLSEWFDRHAAQVAVIRPDRYVHGTAASVSEAEALLLAAARYFPSRS
ncbi:MAG: putative FAD-binding monooxygenase [Marmoricola sp.]|nr:putative FAD-binding monooxygenase [Marmoricola sp.]